MAGWAVSHTPAGHAPVVFKFHRTHKVDPQATVTIWSSDSNQAHEPPVNIVMKQKWPVANEMKTLLLNQSGEVQWNLGLSSPNFEISFLGPTR